MNCKYLVTVHSPVFVGSGEKLSRLDYIVDNATKTIKVIDQTKFIKTLIDRGLQDTYIEYLKQGKKDIQSWLENKRLLDKVDSFTAYSMDIKNSYDFKNNNDIATFIKDLYGQPYIPGSSIKGSIISALIDCKFKNTDNIYPQNNNNKIFATTFGDDFKRTMSQLQISDSMPIAQDTLQLVKKQDFNVETNKEPTSKIPLYRESLKTGTVFEITIGITPSSDFSHEQIEQALSQRFANIYGEKGVIGQPYPKINQYLPALPSGSTPLLLGGGSGFHSKTNMLALCGSVKDANEKTKEILCRNRAFSKHKHDANRIMTPRCLKIGSGSGGANKILGICTIQRI